MRGLTDRQREVVEVIQRHLSTRGVPPTVRELGVELGGITMQAVVDLLRALRRKGVVSWEPYASRTLRIVASEIAPSSARETIEDVERIAARYGYRRDEEHLGHWVARVAMQAGLRRSA